MHIQWLRCPSPLMSIYLDIYGIGAQSYGTQVRDGDIWVQYQDSAISHTSPHADRRNTCTACMRLEHQSSRQGESSRAEDTEGEGRAGATVPGPKARKGPLEGVVASPLVPSNSNQSSHNASSAPPRTPRRAPWQRRFGEAIDTIFSILHGICLQELQSIARISSAIPLARLCTCPAFSVRIQNDECCDGPQSRTNGQGPR